MMCATYVDCFYKWSDEWNLGRIYLLSFQNVLLYPLLKGIIKEATRHLPFSSKSSYYSYADGFCSCYLVRNWGKSDYLTFLVCDSGFPTCWIHPKQLIQEASRRRPCHMPEPMKLVPSLVCTQLYLNTIESHSLLFKVNKAQSVSHKTLFDIVSHHVDHSPNYWHRPQFVLKLSLNSSSSFS